jgi:hypothetical protein
MRRESDASVEPPNLIYPRPLAYKLLTRNVDCYNWQRRLSTPLLCIVIGVKYRSRLHSFSSLCLNDIYPQPILQIASQCADTAETLLRSADGGCRT